MSAKILKGAAVASALNEKTAEMVCALREKGTNPCLAVVRLGERADDISYEKGIIKRCAAVGLEMKQVLLSIESSQRELISAIEALNKDGAVHGILVFMPLPKHIDEKAVREAISPCKDVDGVSSGSAAAVYSGAGYGFAPCTARAVIEILKYYDIPTASRRAAVFGRSMVIGRPVSMLLMAENATVTICHSKTEQPERIAREADIIVAAVGKANALGRDYFAPGQAVIDVGINFSAEGKMLGDVDFSAAETIVGAITPVPGGVGAVTTAVLVRHVVEAAEKYSDKAD